MPVEILMPALSPTMTEGTLAKWLKKEGDNVKSGDVIAEIETDKATMEVEAVDEGIIGKILVAQGAAAVPVNACIALLLSAGEKQDVLKDYVVKAAAKTVQESEKKTSAAEVSAAPSSAPAVSAQKTLTAPAATVPQNPVKMPDISSSSAQKNSASNRFKASPLAKRAASAANVDLAFVEGSGPQGRIVLSDVEAAKRGGNSKIAKRDEVEYEVLPHSSMRKIIAKRLLESKQWVPHFYLTITCRIDKLLALRQDFNDLAPKDEAGKPCYKVTLNDAVIKAVSLALEAVPDANAMWSDEAILRFNNIDVSVAVAIDGGLITPIIRNANQKDLPIISSEMRDLAARARAGKLAPHEFQGGGFSISNLGMYGIKQFSAIINPPQSCILAVGAGEEIVVCEGNNFVKATQMNVTLSCDHRVVDGAVGAQFLQAFKESIENPLALIL